MIKWPRNFGKVCGIAAKRLIIDRYTYRASALAFITLLSLVPLLLVSVFFISIFPIFTKLIKLVQDYIFTNFIPASSNNIQYYLEGFVSKAHQLPALGIIFLFLSASVLLITIMHTLNDIWHAPKSNKKLWRKLIYWLILLFAPLFIGLSILVSSYVFSLSWIAITAKKLGFEIFMLALFPLLINTVIFSMLYIIVPNCHVKWRDGVSGGFTAAVLIEIAKKCFALFLIHFPNYQLIYGVLATIPIFLIWLYISWVIVLYGALVAHTQSQFYKH